MWLHKPFSKENQAKNVLIIFSKQAFKIIQKTDNSGMSMRQRNQEIQSPHPYSDMDSATEPCALFP